MALFKARDLERAIERHLDLNKGDRKRFAHDVVQGVMTAIITNVPHDTNRLKRGYAMAANQANLGPFPVPDVQASKYRKDLGNRLSYQIAKFENSVAFWERIIQTRYLSKGRKGKWLRDAQSKKRTAEKRLARAKEEADKFGATDSALVIFRSSKSGLTMTVRDKVYGGEGREISRPGFHGYQIHNLEPHASIVEKNTRVVAKALADGKALGLKMKGRYTFK